MKIKFKPIVLATLLMLSFTTTHLEAASFGRSSVGVSRSSFSSVSRPVSPPSQPTKGGLGGTSGSVGVTKPNVTNGVKNDIANGKQPSPPTSPPSNTNSGSTYSQPQPSHQSTNYTPPSNTSTFMSSLGGAVVGSAIGNMLFGNHSTGSTVINNTGGATPSVTADAPGVVTNSVAPGISSFKQEYGMWNLVSDLIGLIIFLGILGGVGYAGYKVYTHFKKRKSSNMLSTNQCPVNPISQFWAIQNAFAGADTHDLVSLLGSELWHMADGLTPQQLNITNVKYEVRLQNDYEFSVWYSFNDDGEVINQVWHYERIGGKWLLNGVENV